MPKKKFDPTERIGVSAVDQIISSKFNWIFRDQPVSDIGIDAHIEIIEEKLVNANKELIKIYEQKKKDRIAKVWGE